MEKSQVIKINNHQTILLFYFIAFRMQYSLIVEFKFNIRNLFQLPILNGELGTLKTQNYIISK